MKKGLSILLVLCTLMCMLLTGCGSSSVNLNDYVVITDEGYDGYGTISVKLDYEKLIEDHEDKLTDKNIDSSIFGVKTPKLAAAFVFEAQKPYELSYEEPDTLKNGDKIEFTWETNENAIETLKGILEVNIKYSKFTYTVKDLEALTKVDPFANMEYSTSGFSGSGCVLDHAKAVLDNGNTWDLKVDKEKNGKLSNGDTIKFTIKDSYEDDYYASQYGLVLSRKSADITINDLKYYPIENPKEIFEHISKEDMVNVSTALKGHYDYYGSLFSNCNIGKVEVEYVGAIYFYNDNIDPNELSYTPDSDLAFVYHVTNGIEPDGWYTYVSTGDSSYIKYIKEEDGTLSKRTTIGSKYTERKEFSDAHADYFNESVEFLTFSKVRTDFTYNGKRYAGHQTLKECIEAFEFHSLTQKGKDSDRYNHLVATEGLKDYIEEY